MSEMYLSFVCHRKKATLSDLADLIDAKISFSKLFSSSANGVSSAVGIGSQYGF